MSPSFFQIKNQINFCNRRTSLMNMRFIFSQVDFRVHLIPYIFYPRPVGSVAMKSPNQDFEPTFLNQTVTKSRTCLSLSSLQPWDKPCLPQRAQTSSCSHHRLWLVLQSAVWQSLTERACARPCPVASGAAAAAAIVDSFRLAPVSGPLVLTWIRIKKK